MRLCPMTCGVCGPKKPKSWVPKRFPSLSPEKEIIDDDEPGGPQCVDSPEKMLSGSKYVGCNWVAINKKKRCRKLGGDVAKHCPKTCNKCDKYVCADSTVSFTASWSNQELSCSWAAQKRHKITKRCATKEVAQQCPITCGTCRSQKQGKLKV